MILPPRPNIMGRVLVIDDEQDARQLIGEAVASQEYEVITAASGFEGIELISKGDFDLVLLDVLMEGMDGFETLRRIRAMADRPYLPVILLTALQASHRNFGIEAGADDYLTKPFRIDDLLARVKVGLRLKRLHDSLYHEKARISAMYRISRALNSAEHIREVASIITGDVKTLFEADFADFLLVEDGSVTPLHNTKFAAPLSPDVQVFESIRAVANELTAMDKSDDTILEPVRKGQGINGALLLARHKGNFAPETRSAISELVALLSTVLERCIMRRSLVSDEQRLRHIVEKTTEAFFMLDLDGTLRPLNKRCNELFAISSSAPCKLEALLQKGDFGHLQKSLNSDNKPLRLELTLLDGRIISLSAVLSGTDSAPGSYLCSAFDATDTAVKVRELDRERDLLQQKISVLNEGLSDQFRFQNIVGKTAGMQTIFTLIDRISTTSATVLITGETGTGKELVAKAVHYTSPVKDGPFVKVDCGALTTSLLESELFGHVRGAFTGAVIDKAGRFEIARGGSIFLDEIGNLPLEVQTKLLRVLQDGLFEPVGSNKTIKTDARIIAATNSQLKSAVEQGDFRSDLYFRLNVVSINVPPLRDRQGDVPLLAQHFFDEFNALHKRALRCLANDAVQLMVAYDWPGNVREMRNVIEEAVILSTGPEIGASDLKISVSPPVVKGTDTLRNALEVPERDLLVSTLRKSGWNCSQAAGNLGVSRTTLYKKMKKYGIHPPRGGVNKETAGRR